VCDFGGVLTTPLVDAFAGVQAQAGIPPEALGRALADVASTDGRHPLHELETGRMTEPAFMARIEQALAKELGHEVHMVDFSEMYFSHLRPNRELIDYMLACRREGYRMALCTNNVREWEARWRRMMPVDEIFEVVVDSAFVGVRKPDPEIYALTVQRLGVTAAQCLFLDDFEVNCAAAREAGMTAVRFSSTEQALGEMAALLEVRGQPARP
jgi:epoxide hydrolase-like predicted phosphatase